MLGRLFVLPRTVVSFNLPRVESPNIFRGYDSNIQTDGAIVRE